MLLNEHVHNMAVKLQDNWKRIEYIRANRSQFDFYDWLDLLACCRGRYFKGYASELLS